VQECKQCGLAQVIPRPSKKEVAALYKNDEAHFDPYIEQEFVHRKYFRNKLSAISRQLSAKITKLLDVGCLTGVLLDEARGMGIKAEGIDISKDAVHYCRNRGLLAYEGTIETFRKKFPRKKYHAITAFEIIEHEYSPRIMLETMYVMLEKGGMVMVSTPNHGSWWRKIMGKRWPGYTHPEHLYFFDKESLEYLFKTAGFRDIVVKTGDGRPFPLWFLFKRGADYFPGFAPILKMLGMITRILPIKNPINPWDDLLVIAKK
jgi:2-polyprenyl-3-methyl-5-hydroxy-6-metoxy-1,4-benzoquinol methylase